MKVTSYRDAWVEVSLDALTYNVRQFKNHLQEKSRLMAVVKADGYGHGAVPIARRSLEAGAEYLGVAFIDEALQIREAGILAPILLLGFTPSYAVREAVRHDLTLTVYSTETLEAIKDAARSLDKKAKIHIKVDSGMSRIGLRSSEEVISLMTSLQTEEIEVEGIFTHFADADNDESDAYTYKQFETFQGIMEALENEGYSIPIKHCCNSAATIAFPDMHMDMVRVGISLYGLYPGQHLKEILSLQQVMSFKAKPVLIKDVPPHQPISYGLTYETKETSKIATLPIGYADGFSRLLSNVGHVTVHGTACPIVGRICMDQSMIDVSEVQTDVTKDDIVTIFGDENAGYIPLDVVAEQMQTIHYETVCLIGKRVPRHYV
ncbi:alanine racemase [Oceanobacillus iheyensis HTE831]|uniref:Alanine racemase 1 n=1 Tax=Oceanobacillus iheyensis (strain DSM 14371 / CIP 107618 / JCM 11309 / KCTC 3954 / HTE831) TaxID=221109 RepID=ALR1_OCEIH|nr:alanine racemase [Oceanobacillus iheyensis]Q8ELR9.1 RecName: Full=Alanine racemase 1 [Oceanobacillus iheyensis HTE831]BAC15105.1 alanine racemase [Oceanobacillus iheyensis HTE831]